MSGIFQNALSELEEFVIATVSHRAPSHSDAHMRKVFNTATKLYIETYGEEEISHPRYLLMSVVAWLHDVPDHKFLHEDPTLLIKVSDFLNLFTNTHQEYVKDSSYEELFKTSKLMSIIERISFSKEKKNGDSDWCIVLGTEGIEIRNLVSDADKLEAIGIEGLERCAAFAEEVAERDNISADRKYILKHVIEHYHDKLKLLGTQYCRTEAGKKLAEPLDREMDEEILKLQEALAVLG